MVGLTGGLASGKSTVTQILREQGAIVVDTDEVYHDLLESSTDMLLGLREAFGAEYFDEDGHLERKRLADRVFGDSEAMARLNALTHPFVIEEAQARVDEALSRDRDLVLVFLAVPLLFETRLDGMTDTTVVVSCSPEQQIQRLMSRDGLDEEAARLRIESQMPLSEKVSRADHVLDNSGSLEQTFEQIHALLPTLLAEARKRLEDE